MKTTMAKRTEPSLTGRPVATRELLKTVATLADQVERADHPSLRYPASWRERSLVGLDAPDQDRGTIRACQIQRDAGVLDGAEAFFIINYFASGIAQDSYDADAQLKRIGNAIEAAEEAHGLMDGEYWRIGEAPDDVEKLRAAWDRRADAILAAVFRKHGEDDAAGLLLADRASFMDRVKNGRHKWQARQPILEETGCPPGLDM